MPSSEVERNVAVMKAAYAGYAKGDPTPFLDAVAEDVTLRLVAPPPHYRFGGERRGRAAFLQVVTEIAQDYEWLDYRLFGTIAERDRVVAITGGRIRHRASDTTMELELADVVRLKDGKIIDIVEFFDTAGALAHQAGAAPRKRPLILGPQLAAPATLAAASADETAANVAAMKNVYSAYHQRDPQPFFDVMAEDACYCSHARIEDYPFAGPCHGKANVIENLKRIAEDWQLERYEITDYVAQGPWVAALGDAAFRHMATGKLAQVDKLDILRFAKGKAVEFCEFFDSAGVLLQIGRPVMGAP